MSSDVSDVSSSWFEVLAWIETHKRTLIWVGVGILAVVIVFVTYRWKVTRTEHVAGEALLKLRSSTAAAEPGEAAATAADYLKVAGDYPGTAAAERARLLAVGELFTTGKFAEAQAESEKLLRDHADSELAPSAAYGVAASLEAQGKNDEALAAYRNVAGRYPRSALIEESKLAMARIHEAKGQPELALKMYDEIAQPGTMGGASSQAMQRKTQLLAAHPELAKTNAPAAGATNALPVVTNAVSAKP
jgi:predicted negative regulator of RcsB-dependent stress response